MLVVFLGVSANTSITLAFRIAFTIVGAVTLIVAFGIAFTIVGAVTLIVAFGIAFTIVIFAVGNSFMSRSLLVSSNLRFLIVNTRKLLSYKYFISFSNNSTSVL